MNSSTSQPKDVKPDDPDLAEIVSSDGAFVDVDGGEGPISWLDDLVAIQSRRSDALGQPSWPTVARSRGHSRSVSGV